jgi:hypothetical protein
MSDQTTSKETHCPHQCPYRLGNHVKVFYVDESKIHVVDYAAFRELGRRAAEFRRQKVLELLLNPSLENV